MDIETVKQELENKSFKHNFLIFLCHDNTFVAHQYIKEISKLFNEDINYVALDSLNSSSSDIFGTAALEPLNCCCIDEFDETFVNYGPDSKVFIICKKISVGAKQEFEEYVVDVPKLEPWMLKDYAYSISGELSRANLDYLVEICGNNIHRLDNELNKINIFNDIEKNSVFEDFITDGIFNDLSVKTIFDLNSAIIRRDATGVKEVYKQLDSIDVEPMGLLVLLYRDFRNIILIQLDSSSTAGKMGMSDKQFYVVKKYNCGHYNKNELIKIFSMLTKVDRDIKAGVFPVDYLLDYLIVNTIGVVA